MSINATNDAGINSKGSSETSSSSSSSVNIGQESTARVIENTHNVAHASINGAAAAIGSAMQVQGTSVLPSSIQPIFSDLQINELMAAIRQKLDSRCTGYHSVLRKLQTQTDAEVMKTLQQTLLTERCRPAKEKLNDMLGQHGQAALAILYDQIVMGNYTEIQRILDAVCPLKGGTPVALVVLSMLLKQTAQQDHFLTVSKSAEMLYALLQAHETHTIAQLSIQQEAATAATAVPSYTSTDTAIIALTQDAELGMTIRYILRKIANPAYIYILRMLQTNTDIAEILQQTLLRGRCTQAKDKLTEILRPHNPADLATVLYDTVMKDHKTTKCILNEVTSLKGGTAVALVVLSMLLKQRMQQAYSPKLEDKNGGARDVIAQRSLQQATIAQSSAAASSTAINHPNNGQEQRADHIAQAETMAMFIALFSASEDQDAGDINAAQPRDVIAQRSLQQATIAQSSAAASSTAISHLNNGQEQEADEMSLEKIMNILRESMPIGGDDFNVEAWLNRINEDESAESDTGALTSDHGSMRVSQSTAVSSSTVARRTITTNQPNNGLTQKVAAAATSSSSSMPPPAPRRGQRAAAATSSDSIMPPPAPHRRQGAATATSSSSSMPPPAPRPRQRAAAAATSNGSIIPPNYYQRQRAAAAATRNGSASAATTGATRPSKRKVQEITTESAATVSAAASTSSTDTREDKQKVPKRATRTNNSTRTNSTRRSHTTSSDATVSTTVTPSAHIETAILQSFSTENGELAPEQETMAVLQEMLPQNEGDGIVSVASIVDTPLEEEVMETSNSHSGRDTNSMEDIGDLLIDENGKVIGVE